MFSGEIYFISHTHYRRMDDLKIENYDRKNSNGFIKIHSYSLDGSV